MKITILTVGSRGDVQPFIALGQGFKAAGHEVLLATHEIFRDMAEEYDLAFEAVGGDPRQFFEKDIRKVGDNPLRYLRWARQVGRPEFKRYTDIAWRLSQDSDALVLSTFAALVGLGFAEKLKIPAMVAHLVPVNPTKEYPVLMAPRLPSWMPMRGRYNRLSYRSITYIFFRLFKGQVNEWRRTQALPELSTREMIRRFETMDAPTAYGISPSVLPPPDDWSANIRVTGYWFLDATQDWQPPRHLLNFLDSGSPPVYIGFGSMIDTNADHTADLIIKALERTGQRGIFLGGWTNLDDIELPEHILKINEAPHSWLFPRMAAIAHHGGAGTTAAGLRAGVPTIVVPFFGDQPFWGTRIYELGVGPKSIAHADLTVDGFAQAIRTATEDHSIRQAAAHLGEQIRQEDGVGAGLAYFDEVITAFEMSHAS